MLWSTRLARTTMARAFQRIRVLIRRSISWSPGNTACFSTGMVLTYGVFAVNAGPAPNFCARERRRSSNTVAASWPSSFRTASNDSIHSCISWGSMPITLVTPLLSVIACPCLQKSIEKQNSHALRKTQTSHPARTGGFTSVDKSTWLVTGRHDLSAPGWEAPEGVNSGPPPEHKPQHSRLPSAESLVLLDST